MTATAIGNKVELAGEALDSVPLDMRQVSQGTD